MSNKSMKKTSEKQRAACLYDGLGKRRIKAVGDETHYWRWDAGYNVVAEYKDQTPDWDVGALQRFFVPFGHTALAEATPGAGGSVTNGTYTYLAHDHLGTSRNGYNQSQTEIHSNEHLPFGQRFSTTGTVPYHEWTGKPWDADTQMYYFPYRYYSPMMNRWTAADPLGLVDGPNLYSYVGGNPISNSDFLGLHLTEMLPNAYGPRKPYKRIYYFLKGCENAPPAHSDSGICLRYGPCDSYLWHGARCVCEHAGNTPWDQDVRGCLACAKDRGVRSDHAHEGCYDVADTKYGFIHGKLRRAHIGLTVSPGCLWNYY